MYHALDLGVSVEAFWEMSPRAIWLLQRELSKSMDKQDKPAGSATAPKEGAKRLARIPR